MERLFLLHHRKIIDRPEVGSVVKEGGVGQKLASRHLFKINPLASTLCQRHWAPTRPPIFTCLILLSSVKRALYFSSLSYSCSWLARNVYPIFCVDKKFLISCFLVKSRLISRNLSQLIWTYGSATTSQGLNETEWKCSLFRFWIFFLQRLTMYLAVSQNWTHSKGAVTRFLLFSKEAATSSSGISWHFSSDCSDNIALMNLRLLVSGRSASHSWPCWSKRHTFQVSQKSSANIKTQKLKPQKLSNPKTTLAALPGAKKTPLSAFHLPVWPILQTSPVQGWVRPYVTQGHRIFIFRIENHSHGKGPGNTRAVYAKTRFSRGLTQTCRTCYQVQTPYNFACKIFLSGLTSNWRGHLIGHVTIKQDWRLCFLDSLDFPSTGEIQIAGTGSLQIMWYEVEKHINVEIFFLHFSLKGPCSQASMQFGKVPQWNRKTKEIFIYFWSS